MRSLLLRLILQLLLLPILPTVYALSTAALRKHYASLGVSPKAGAGEIKRAYKKLAMKWHPDKNPSNKAAAEKKFKEINAAYQILNDPVKRKEYDQYGEDSNKYSIPRGMDSSQFSFKFGNFGGRSQGSPDTSFMADDILGSMFQNIFRDPMGFQKSRYQPERRSDINTRSVEKTLSISLEEAFRGCKKKFRMKDVVLGRSIQRDIVIDVKPGWKTGTIVKFPAINTFPVAVKFKVSVQKHPFLERIGDDLRWTCKLTKAQFENGVVIKVPMIDGTVIEQSTRELESSAVNGTTKIYENRGMPISSGMTHHYFEEKRGNFILLFEIVP